MSERTKEQIAADICEVLEKYVAPAVAQHGGIVNYVDYKEGHVLLELSGACSGCSGSTMTLKYGVENMLKEMVPEVEHVDGMDDPNSGVSPYMTDPYYFNDYGHMDDTDY
tara:strand:- start:104 stop:433 length:330 start_codon:yes stop_codon:yes gene_type:complete